MKCTELATEHLALRLRPIHRALRAAAARQSTVAARLDRPDLAGVCVTDRQVADLLDDVGRLIEFRTPASCGPAAPLTDAERAAEQRLRTEAQRSRILLPLDRLTEALGLDAFEQEALVLSAGAELDRAYERIFAYVLDDVKRIFPCVELLCSLEETSIAERLARRRAVGQFGKLRRCGLLEQFGEPATGLRTQLRLAPGVLEFLSGHGPEAAGLWRDPAEVDLGRAKPASAGEGRWQKIGRALAERAVAVVGIWGDPTAADEAAAAVARAAGTPLRRLPSRPAAVPADPTAALQDALRTSAMLGAVLQIPVAGLRDGDQRRDEAELAALLAGCAVPLLLTGRAPWRPTCLLASRPYTEIELLSPAYADSRAVWRDAMPEGDGARLDDLAGRFRMSRQEVDAAVRLARTQARLEGNGKPVLPAEKLEAACVTVAHKSAGRLVTAIRPRRGPDDLILPPDLHQQVLEIARFTRVLPRVTEGWGFSRLATGGSGIKALFTGDPGTGKTLAAEVIGVLLGLSLLKVNLGQTVSKWIGETEKNLDEAFAEAEAAHALLFIDEADALCGKRGDVRHGSDRYANTEVSHLLQKMEEYDGLVILASNLKDNIDPAFLRRFHVMLHFPRPCEPERRRLWRLAFPPQSPLDRQVDLEGLTRLDMTGAGIMSAARTAALLAADQGSAVIGMNHVVQGILRQYRRESRVLTPAELGRHAVYMRET